MKGDYFHVRNEFQRGKARDALMDRDIGEFGFLVKFETGLMTTKQRGSIHVYFGLLANELNDAGLERRVEFLGKSIEVPWDKDSVKKYIWKPAMLAATGKTSTTKINRKEVNETYEILHRHFASQHAIMVPFPCDEPPMV